MTTFLGSYWKEIALGLLLAALLGALHVIGNRDDTINGLNNQITEINAVNSTNTKWTTATTEVLTNVISQQNDGIDRVIKAVSESAAGITASVDAKRASDAKANAALTTYITNLPKATNCNIMMDNFIKSGGAVKW